MIVGFDVGGTNARGLLIDASDGTVVDRRHQSSAGSGPVLRDTLARMVDELRTANEVTVDAVGLGIAGLAERTGVVRYSPNLPDLVEYPLGAELAGATGVGRVAVINEATAGALAEWRLGAGRGTDDFAFVALGTGIGTGFVTGGRLLLGANGFAGEAGHMQVQFDGPDHHTGQRGPWEYYASGSALGRMGREAAAAGRFAAGVAHAGAVASIDGHTVAAVLDDGDADAARILAAFAREVARGMANLVMVLDPARIVLGGGLVGIGEPLRTAVDRELADHILGADHRPRVPVVLAELGGDASAIGAGLLALDDG